MVIIGWNYVVRLGGFPGEWEIGERVELVHDRLSSSRRCCRSNEVVIRPQATARLSSEFRAALRQACGRGEFENVRAIAYAR